MARGFGLAAQISTVRPAHSVAEIVRSFSRPCDTSTTRHVDVWLRDWTAIDKAESASVAADKGEKTTQGKYIRLDVRNTHTTATCSVQSVAA